MPITELATIYLKSPIKAHSKALLPILQKAKSVQERASGYPAYYLEDTAKPNQLYIVGSWESRDAHMVFIPQKENQEVLELLMPLCVSEKPVTLVHINVGIQGIGREGFINSEGMQVFSYGVESKWKSEIEVSWEEGDYYRLLRNYKEVGGWTIEKENEGKEVFVLMKGIDGEGDLEDPSSLPAFPMGDDMGGSSDTKVLSCFTAKRLEGISQSAQTLHNSSQE